MISRSTVVGALVVAELTIAGLSVAAIAEVGPPGIPAFQGLPESTRSGPGLQRTFETGTAPHVVVDVHDVDVFVHAGSSPSVRVTEAHGSSGWVTGEVSQVTAQQTADGVRISTPASETMHVVFGRYWRQLHVYVPAAAQVEVASAGETTVNGLRSKLVAHIPDGRIYINNHRGDVDVSTGNGRITMTDVQGSDIAANTRDGRIYLTRVGADRIDASSGSGRIVGVDVRAVNGALTTRDGRIVVSFAANSDATVSAHTDDDSVEVTGLNKTSGDGSSAVLQLGSGHGRFEIQTASGPVILTQGASV
jgi:DUF4097 and DUF4098 domain-containing protein YvlB